MNKANLKRALLVTLLFCFLIPQVGFAAEGAIIKEEDVKELEKPGIVEKYLSGWLVNTGNAMIKVFKAQDVSYLVFQRPDIAKDDWLNGGTKAASRDELVLGIFPEEYFNGIAIFYDAFEKLLPIPIAVLMALAGIALLFGTLNSENRTNFKDYLLGLIIVIVSLRFAPILWNLIMEINYWMVDLVYVTLKDNGITVTRFLDTIWGGKSGYEALSTSQSFGVALLIFIAIFQTFILNYQYAMRMITLSILFLMFPIIILAAIFPSKRGAVNTWFHEVISNVSLQAAHALALGVFFYANSKLSSIGFWLVIAFLLGLPAVTNVVRTAVSAFTGQSGSSGVGGQLAGMSGLSSMMAVSRVMNDFMGKGGKQKVQNEAIKATPRESNGNNNLNEHFSSDNNSSSTTGGVVPLSDGTGPKSNTKLGAVTRAAGKAGQKIGGSLANGRLNTISRKGLTLGGAVGGGVISTMASGSASTGAAVGSGVASSNLVSRATGFMGKVGQTTGEAIEGLSNVKDGVGSFGDAFTPRTGFQDTSQLFDTAAAGAIGKNALGTPGEIAGKGIALANQGLHKISGGSYGANSMATKEWLSGMKQSRDQALQKRNQGQSKLQEAKLKLEQAQAQHGASDSKERSNPELDRYRQEYNQVVAETKQYELEAQQLTNSINSYYQRANQVKQMNSLKSEVRSSGRL